MSLIDELRKHAQLSSDEARMLPLAAYASDEMLGLEIEHLFTTDWLCVGRTADLPNVGDYVTAEVPWSDGSTRSLIVVRSHDRTIRTFDNVCVHRGARLLEGCGNEARITCPYHAWVYRLDGSLVGAPHMTGAMEHDGTPFDTSRHGLVGVRTEVWEGFVFVNQDVGATPLAPRLEGLHDVVGRYATADYVPIHDEVEVWDTNWKLLVENFVDAYHVFKVHRDSFGAFGDSTDDTVVFPGTDHWAHHRVVDGGDVELAHPSNDRLLDEWRRTIVIASVFPGFLMQLQPNWLWFLRIHPLGTDRVRIAWHVAVAPDVFADQEASGFVVDDLMALIRLVNSEDRPIVEGLRRSVHRPQFERAPMSGLERNVHDFDRYVSRRVSSRS